MAITYNPYNWEIRPRSKKTIKSIKKNGKNTFNIKMELDCTYTREELIDLFHDVAKELPKFDDR